jgi:hypothetical protein
VAVFAVSVCAGAQTAPHWDDASLLIKALQQEKNSRDFLKIAERLRELKAVQSMPVLVSSLEREFVLEKHEQHPAKTALARWSWQGVGPALRGLRSQRRTVRLGCAQILLSRAEYRPQDKRLLPAYEMFARDSDPEFRRIGTLALCEHAIGKRIDRMGDGWLPFDILNLQALADLAKMTADKDAVVAEIAATKVHGLLWSRGAGAPRMGVGGYVDRELAAKEREQYVRFLKDKEPGMRIAALTMMAYGSGAEKELSAALNDPVKEVREVAKALLAK